MNTVCLGLLLAAMGAPDKPAVIFITVDTLRADRLECYGCERPTSPFWSRLAQDSVLFEQTFAQSSFTPPSHASLMTSLYVRQHQLKSWDPLRNKHKTLAELLRKEGFRTYAINSLNLLTLQNLGQGFTEFEERARSAEQINEMAMEWIGKHPEEKIFVWLHYYDVHSPYARQGDAEKMFHTRGRLEVGRDKYHYGITPPLREQLGFGEDDYRRLEDRYDAGVRYMDTALQSLVDGLKKTGIWDRTLLVLTADHGESFDERYGMYFAHGPFLYDDVIRVPLLFRFPGDQHKGTRVSPMVESIDVAPTVLDYLGIQAPTGFEGRSLLPVIRGEAPGRDEVFSECWKAAVRKSIRTNRWKYIWTVIGDQRELFDLQADSRESENVHDQHPEVAARMHARLTEWVGDTEDTLKTLPNLSDEVIDQLRDLGYIGGGYEDPNLRADQDGPPGDTDPED